MRCPTRIRCISFLSILPNIGPSWCLIFPRRASATMTVSMETWMRDALHWRKSCWAIWWSMTSSTETCSWITQASPDPTVSDSHCSRTCAAMTSWPSWRRRCVDQNMGPAATEHPSAAASAWHSSRLAKLTQALQVELEKMKIEIVSEHQKLEAQGEKLHKERMKQYELAKKRLSQGHELTALMEEAYQQIHEHKKILVCPTIASLMVAVFICGIFSPGSSKCFPQAWNHRESAAWGAIFQILLPIFFFSAHLFAGFLFFFDSLCHRCVAGVALGGNPPSFRVATGGTWRHPPSFRVAGVALGE